MKKLVFVFLLVCVLMLALSACTVQMAPADKTTVPPCEHEYSEWVEFKAPSCTAQGMQMRVCTLCQGQEWLPMDKLEHTEVIDQAVAPTCTQTGLTEGKHCSACGEVFVAQETIPAEGHDDQNNDGICDICPTKLASIGLAYTLSDDGTYYSVSGIGNCIDTDIFIPLMHNGLPVKEIASEAFSSCDSLTGVVIPDSVTSIGYSAFSFCSNLTSVTLGNSVTTIGNCAFSDCSNLTSVVIPDSVTTIGNSAFYFCSNLTSVILGNGVTTIGTYAFSDCSKLTSIAIPDSITAIGGYAFEFCSNLTDIYIFDIAAWCNISFDNHDANPQSYAENLYLNGQLVTDLIIPEGVISISDFAFYNCDSLLSITIPDSVTAIGYYAFSSCGNLTSVVIGDSVTSIEDAFYGCYKLVEVINHSTLDIQAGTSDYGDIGYYAKEVHKGESKIVNQNGYLFYSYQGVNYLFGYTGNERDLILPENYNGEPYEINQYAFYNCDSMTSVVIPDSVTSIGGYAFGSCDSLTGAVIPDSVTSIGERAFAWCDSLTNVVIPDSVTSIGDWAFYDCDSLTSVVIGDSVTSIGDRAFAYCTGLKNIYYRGTASQWKAISKGSYWNAGTGSFAITYNYTGE